MKTKNFLFMATLLLSSISGIGQNLLMNGNFENSMPTGTFPTSAWRPSWYPKQAGSVTTSNAARTGKCGLWMYTAFDGNGSSFSKPFQELSCTLLLNYKAEAYLRTPLNLSWGPHSFACIKIEFINSSGFTIKSAYSDSLKTGNTDCNLFHDIFSFPEINQVWGFIRITRNTKCL
jgi:hypothetical protein